MNTYIRKRNKSCNSISAPCHPWQALENCNGRVESSSPLHHSTTALRDAAPGRCRPLGRTLHSARLRCMPSSIFPTTWDPSKTPSNRRNPNPNPRSARLPNPIVCNSPTGQAPHRWPHRLHSRPPPPTGRCSDKAVDHTDQSCKSEMVCVVDTCRTLYHRHDLP